MRLDQGAGPGGKGSPVPLEPFGHQVAGQASMLAVDPCTVCKPLIPREHFLYRTLPPQLQPFTARYKGVLYVRLKEEDDGRLNLWGYPSDNPHDNAEADPEQLLQATAADWSSGTSTPISSGSEPDLQSAVDTESRHQGPSSKRCVVRLKQDGEYVMQGCNAEGSRFLVSSDDEGPLQAQAPETQPLNPWGFSQHTRLLDKMRKSQVSASGCPFLMLENVVAGFRQPCILDLKVGSRLHGDDASSKKIASQTLKCSITTSRTLGLRLCGMQVYQETTGAYQSHDKYFGRTLNDDSFRDVLRQFLHNGRRLREELLSPILTRLDALISCLKKLDSFRFYASSLLIIYEGFLLEGQGGLGGENEDGNLDGKGVEADYNVEAPVLRVHGPTSDFDRSTPTTSSDLSPSTSTLTSLNANGELSATCVASDNGNRSSDPLSLVDVRMIDFAHTTHSGFHDDLIVHDGPDLDYVWGLTNLRNLFTQMLMSVKHDQKS